MLKTPSRSIDWNILVRQILKDTSCTVKELGQATNLPPHKLSKVRTDATPLHATADQAVSLLMVFMANTSRDIPIVGDYYNENDEPINQ